VWGLARLANWGTRKPLELMAPLAEALTRERMLLVRYDAALDRWDDGDLTDKELQQIFQKELIPEWQKMREVCRLRVPNEDQFSGSVLAELRKLSGRNPARAGAKKPATPEQVVELFRVYTKARLEDWTAFSGTL